MNFLARTQKRLRLLRSLISCGVAFHGVAAIAANATMTFGNDTSCLIINGGTGNPIAAAEGVHAALYSASVGSSFFTQLGGSTLVGVPLPGIIAAGSRQTTLFSGTDKLFQIRAWGGPYATFEDAQAAGGVLLGESGIVQATLGKPDAAPPTPPGSLFGLQRFALTTNGVPLLSIRKTATNTVIVAWPSSAPGYALQANTNLATTNWSSVSQFPSDDGTSKQVTEPASGASKYYRLKK